MSSISGIEKRTASTGARGLTVDLDRIRAALGRWFMFSDYGPAAQRQMAMVWSCVLACILADTIWLPGSRLSFASSNWTTLVQCLAYCAFAGAFVTVASSRLAADQRRPAMILRSVLLVTELLWRAVLPIGALLIAGSTLSYLITAADLPLRDSALADVDHLLGFDWPDFLRAANASPLVAMLLTKAYLATGLITQLVLLWLVLRRRGDRLVEFMAVLSLSTVALCITMWLVPAAGAFAYFKPAPQIYGNFAAFGEMWSFSRTFAALRDGALSVFDLSNIDGVVSFPSFHTMLGVMTIYAARDTRWVALPVLVVNATMIVATMPVGGHHLADVLAGAGLTIGAIFLVRRSSLPA
ncbi:phosphatase PAP2 family protein [Bradyrhizobium jicamae]|uniref:Phosphatase PAP2 family protein n=1 Tax=Bradyrhizobium jicamae TaxID=280332 RepID=A0ABS5FLZ7_9BRAD|nr:phosphatase PAP2 family protein [Bradyrhizobium jicamae]MBR0797795.1 phosphatase PAP2 family protein [Bradyrhizobium jicamae]MBR0936009.1 phosphatase PAP2 family protein [Bradyrhizobium jicamae]